MSPSKLGIESLTILPFIPLVISGFDPGKSASRNGNLYMFFLEIALDLLMAQRLLLGEQDLPARKNHVCDHCFDTARTLAVHRERKCSDQRFTQAAHGAGR